LRGKGPPDRIVGKTLASSVSSSLEGIGSLYPVAAAVLRDSLCRVIAAVLGRLLYVVHRVCG